MKRILSVILSLALLASALIIPMSVSAEVAEAETSAAQAVINAVNGLTVDLNAVNPIELAVPVDSRTALSDKTWNTNTDASTSKITIEKSTNPTVGTTTVKVKEDNLFTQDIWGLKKDDLHVIKYSVNVSEKMSYVKDIDYIVVYVKTNRSFKMRLGTHNGYSFAGAITDDIQVSAKEGYQPVAISLQEDGFVKNKPNLYANNKSFTQGIYLSIASMTDGENNTIAGSDITFGSILYVPGDTAARDFKYTIDSNALTVTDRFAAADGLSADMIIAAEKIENDGRYTADSFTALQGAISDAKKVLIDKNNETEVVDLFKQEVERLYKLEEVFRPKFVETGANEGSLASTPGDISNLGLTADQQESFGDYVAVATNANTHVHFVDTNATQRYPGDGAYLKTYSNYKNLYLAVYNTGNAFEATRFSFYKQFNDGIALVNKKNNKFELHNGYYLYSLYSTSVVNYQDRFLLDYAANVHSGEDHPITQANRVQVALDNAIPSGANVYFGSILGEVAFNTSTIDNDVTDKATLVKFYADNIANKGYENSAAVEETMELLGITTVPVVRELGNTIGINETSNYTLNAAVVGENVSFTLTDKPAGVDVTVKYGANTIVPDNGVYTITVEKGKELHIIPSHSTTNYTKAEITDRFTTANNVAFNIVPKLYKTTTTRTEKLLRDEVDIAKLSNGNLSDSNAEVSFDITFKKKVDNKFTDYVNNYTPGEAFNFNQESYDAYVDLVYDLGRPTDINKFQHIAASDGALAMAVYQLYASDSATNLFSADSLICNYQNKDTGLWSGKKSQEIEFPTRTAQYVAIRCYMPITICDETYNENAGTGNYFYNCFRIGDIAIYGTPSDTAAYKVTEIQAPTGGSDAPTDVPNKESDLLNSATFESIKSFENGKLVKTDEKFYNRDTNLGKLNSQSYWSGDGHGNFDLDVVFYANNTCKNGYSIDRTNTNGNITFTVPTEAPTVYYDFTYDLGDYYKIDRFGAYLNSAMDRRIQAYEVYIGNDRASLYTGEPVVVYNNYYNTYGQMITFDQAKVGKYIGFRVLNPSTANDNGNTYVRLDELAAYGTKVGAPADENLKAAITSNGVYILDNNNSSVYTGTDGTQRTALRLTVGYKSPKVPGGANASKIILANGAEANVIERNVIAIAKSKYDKLDDDAKNNFGINTTGASVTISTATSTDYPVSNYFKSEEIKETDGSVNQKYRMAYGALNLNNISAKNKESQIVVRGRVVYEYQGEIYAVYSNIVGNETGKEITAQAAYNKLNDPSQGWFK